jgi:hypothetical protein
MSSIVARVVILVLFAVILSAASSYAAGAQPATSHVRTSESIIAGLIRQGIAESASFRALVSRLDASDVVVYVRFERQLSAQLEGQLTFVGGGGGRRYVVVALAWGRPDLRALATLGHELQHAVEVAEHPEIIDSDTLADGYEAFGHATRRVATARSYETAAAIDAGHRVWKELCHRGE